MRIGVPAETRANEARVAATPETVKKLVSQGHRVTVQSGAGLPASYIDDAYAVAGAELVDVNTAFAAEIVLKVQSPSEAELPLLKRGAGARCERRRESGGENRSEFTDRRNADSRSL